MPGLRSSRSMHVGFLKQSLCQVDAILDTGRASTWKAACRFVLFSVFSCPYCRTVRRFRRHDISSKYLKHKKLTNFFPLSEAGTVVAAMMGVFPAPLQWRTQRRRRVKRRLLPFPGFVAHFVPNFVNSVALPSGPTSSSAQHLQHRGPQDFDPSAFFVEYV